MCVSAPKAPKVQDIPIRAAALMPDNGDPSVQARLKTQRGLVMSSMILANRGGSLGAPTTSAPLGA